MTLLEAILAELPNFVDVFRPRYRETDDEAVHHVIEGFDFDVVAFAAAIEAKLRAKPGSPQETPEQIAYRIVHYSSGPGDIERAIVKAIKDARAGKSS